MAHRSRERSYARDWERSRPRERDLGTRRYRRDEDYDFDDDDDDDDEEDYDSYDNRRRRGFRSGHESRERSARGYGRGYARSRRYGDEYDDEEDDEEESSAIFVDSRPGRARRPESGSRPRPSPARGSPRTLRDREREYEEQMQREFRRQHERLQYARYSRPKAKESPATSPVKQRDRERDREGRRKRDSTADEGSPLQRGELRDRRGKERGGYMEAGRSAGEETERERERRRARRRERERKHVSADSANSATQLLSANALAKLDAKNKKAEDKERARAAKEEKRLAEREKKRRKKEGLFAEKLRGRGSSTERERKRGKKRLVSGAIMEEGRGPELRVRGGHKSEKWRRGGGDDDDDDDGIFGWRAWSKKKRILIALALVALLLIIIIPIAVTVSKKDGDKEKPSSVDDDDLEEPPPPNDELKYIDRDSIPDDKKNTYFDPWTWYDTQDFNVTYTDTTVGTLPIMGLNSTWDDSTRPNDNVPPLDEKFPYGKQPIRGVNVGGWLSIEPFITPSFFEPYKHEVVDEWELTEAWGKNAAKKMEKHYSSFINKQTFKEIREAGFDHVRIPYGYWIVEKYEGEPYVERIGWRYLLRAIEYCRENGLRVSLDMHGVPGSQNGWNHSGKHGEIRWLNGEDGDLWGDRAMDIHDKLSKFFSQDRYKNVITMYGLANEPRIRELESTKTFLDWTEKAAKMVANNGMDQYVIIGEGFLPLDRWRTMLQDTGQPLVLDAHLYMIFDTNLIKMDHEEKLKFVCKEWTRQISESVSKETGFGPTLCGEWSQADTDCAKYLTNVGVGTRWEGNYYDIKGKGSTVFQPHCPAHADGKESDQPPCSCEKANEDPSNYSDTYKTFLKTYAEAQISAFEKGWGWFYWTWKTETAVHWSWKKGLEAGIVPKKAYAPEFKCGDAYPNLDDLPGYY